MNYDLKIMCFSFIYLFYCKADFLIDRKKARAFIKFSKNINNVTLKAKNTGKTAEQFCHCLRHVSFDFFICDYFTGTNGASTKRDIAMMQHDSYQRNSQYILENAAVGHLHGKSV